MPISIKSEISDSSKVLFANLEKKEIDISFYGFHEKEFNNFDLLCSFRIGDLAIKPIQNLGNQEFKNRKFNYFSSSIGLRKFVDKIEFDHF